MPIIYPSLLLLLSIISGPPLSAQGTNQPHGRADRIIVLKSERTLELMREGKVLKKYKVALGSQPIGAKQKQGDHKTPEGIYIIDFKKKNSQFHRALHVSYPSALDRKRAVNMKVNPGGDIMIHGLAPSFAWVGSKHLLTDWTDGCIAVTNQEIEEIWELVPEGTPIEIRP